MKVWLIPLLAVLMTGAGCTNITAPVSSLPVEDGTASTVNNNPDAVIELSETATTNSLMLTGFEFQDITSSSTILKFNSNINCTAIVKLYNGEILQNIFSTNYKVKEQYIALTGLNPDTTYTVVIEAEGSSAYKAVKQFTTLSEVVIHDSVSSTWFGGGYYSYSSGDITAVFVSCDGSFSGNIWTVSGYAGEIKQLVLSVHNGTGNSKTVIFGYSLVSYPSGSIDKVVLSGDNVTIVSGATQNFIIEAKIEADAPIGEYKFNINLGY